MMRPRSRTVLHAGLLALLIASALYGVMMVLGFLMMLAGAASPMMPTTDLGTREIVLGALMTVLWGGVIIAGLGSLARQLRRSVALARWVEERAVPMSPELVEGVETAGRSGVVLEVDSQTPFAFTYGIWTPRVVISSALVDRASAAELEAVLRHESSHVRHRDPLKVLTLRTFATALGFLPAVSALARGILDRLELRADRSAVHRCGVPPVAGALLKSVGTPPAGAGTALAAMGSESLLETRIAHLESGEIPGLARAVRPALLPSLPGVMLLGLYAVLLFQVCFAARVCCRSMGSLPNTMML